MLRQTWQEFPMWSAHHLTPDISLEFSWICFAKSFEILRTQPVLRSHCRLAVEPQARWLNSTSWRGWLGWSWRGRLWTGRGRSLSHPSRRAPGGRGGRRGSRTGPPSTGSPPTPSSGWGSPRRSTGLPMSRIHPQTCTRGCQCWWKCLLSAKTW